MCILLLHDARKLTMRKIEKYNRRCLPAKHTFASNDDYSF